MNPLLETKWHALEILEIFKILRSGEHGLSEVDTRQRLKKYGPNKLPEAKVESIFVIFLRQFENPLIYILLIAGIVVLFMDEIVDSIVITAVLVFNAIIGAIQEGKARNTMLALKKFVETKAVVIRDGEEQIIADENVVPGDIIILQEGEKIPADARLITARNLKVDEAALTGESVAVNKQPRLLTNPRLPIFERRNIVFKGTAIVAGNGLAIVIATGAETFIGKIAKEVATLDTDIPLKKEIKGLSKVFIIATAVICILLFILGILYGYSAREMFATAVSMAVSAIPSGLPIALTIILASGVWRMGKRNALVKKLQAVEALGQARVIAVDKTGTITKNEMMVCAVYIGGKTFEIGGVGYEPNGNVKLDGDIIEHTNYPELILAGKLVALCAHARVMFEKKKREWIVSGDPTEAAMFVFGKKLGFNKDNLEKESPLVSEIPFNYSLKFHATLHKEGKKNMMSVSGAPETVLTLSNKILVGGKEKKMSKSERDELEKIIASESRKGLRVLALAIGKKSGGFLDKNDVKNLTFIAFLGLKDALRQEVHEATRRARDAGVRVVMITGDHKETAVAIAKEAGIYRGNDSIIVGTEIESLSSKELQEKLANTSVFARVTPEHKLKIIEAYKARGEIVAMTGDGVNDAPSLVAADLGVAMGITGTEVAKEASDIVLLDDNFGSIISAIEEGRGIYKTIKKVVVYLVSTSIGEVLVITGSLLVGLPLPLLAAQIIWLNFVTDGFFIPALAMEPREDNLLKAKFIKPSKYLVDKDMLIRMLIMATPMTIFTLILFAGSYKADVTRAMTIALTILAVFQWFNAWNSRSETESIFKMNFWSNKFLIAGTLVALLFQLLAVYHPFLQSFLHTVPLDISDWLVIITLSSSIILTEEFRKYLWRNRKSSSSSAQPLQAKVI